MTPYQSGIIAEASSDALFITFNFNTTHVDNIKTALAAAPQTVQNLQAQYPDSELHACIGLSHQAWHKFDDKSPIELAPFPSMQGKDIDIKPTDVDLVFHIRSIRHDLTYQLADILYKSIAPYVSIVEEVNCFKYLDNRDLTGFVDGTENPNGDSRKTVALVAEEDADFQNGSYLNLMRFVHNLSKWEKQDIKDQEDIYGRTKEENIEYPSDKKSIHSHTKRTSLKDDNGKSMEILRHSMPYASLAEKGLMFASYSKTPTIFNLMLESMVKGDEHGHTDHLMKYTTAETGQAFFVPSNAWLTSLNR